MVMDRKEGSGLDKVFTLLYALYWVEKKREREREKKRNRNNESKGQMSCQISETANCCEQSREYR